jgi:hypothetical protein
MTAGIMKSYNGSSSALTVLRDCRLTILAIAATAYIFTWTTLIPVFSLDFFGDDFAFLNWTARLTLRSWLSDWVAPNHFNLTYRPVAMFVYLVYGSANASLGYALLVILCAVNLAVLYYVFRRLTNPSVAALALVIFAGGFMYYDATHKVYNLITQLSALFFLLALQIYLIRLDRGKGSRHFAYLAFALSLLTYEITLFGFLVFFAVALAKLSDGKGQRIGLSIIEALKASWVFGLISCCYLIVNYLTPIKAAHLREHAIPIAWSTVPIIFARARNVFTNTLAWVVTLDQSMLKNDLLTFQWTVPLFLLITVFTLLMVTTPTVRRRDQANAGLGLVPLTFIGLVWFVALLLPGAVSSYFDYRMTFVAYAGFSLLVAALIHGYYVMLVTSLSIGCEFALAGVALVFAGLLSIWLLSNVSLTLRMNRNLLEASRAQLQILNSIAPYRANFKSDSVVAIQYPHAPDKGLPYPYQASPFAEDYALGDALRFYYDKDVADASLFFRPLRNRFEIGRFAFAQNSYGYDRLHLFMFEQDHLVPSFVYKLPNWK